MVQTNAIMFGWNKAIPGREAVAGELFAHAVNWFDKQKSIGNLETWEPVFLHRHGGDLNGFFLIKGTHAQLDSLQSNDDFVDLVMRADHSLLNVGVISAYTGNMVPETMTRWMKTIPSK